MGLLRKRSDPITERSRKLSSEIASLEEEIRRLGSRLEHAPSRASGRPATTPRTEVRREEPAALAAGPVFEPVNHQRVKGRGEERPAVEQQFNDLGVRKFDLPAAWARLKDRLRGPAASNPRLVNYLAAGSFQGLRPLRYEKRVARNRVVALTVILIVVIWGLVAGLVRH